MFFAHSVLITFVVMYLMSCNHKFADSPFIIETSEILKKPASAFVDGNVVETKIANEDSTASGKRLCTVNLNIVYLKDLWFDVQSDPHFNSCRGPCQAASYTTAALRSTPSEGLNFSENSPNFEDFDVNWILNGWPGDAMNGIKLEISPGKTRILIGPNVLEGDNDNFPDRRHTFPYVYHLAPSEWVADAWKSRGWLRTLGFCPSPVDTQRWSLQQADTQTNFTGSKRAFGPGNSPYVEAKCILYIKRIGKDQAFLAHPDLLVKAEDWLRELGLQCQIFTYGSYSNKDLQSAAVSADFAVIVDGTETQGYALQSIMAADVPVFLIGNNLGHVYQMAPYFDKVRSGAFATLQTDSSLVLKHFLARLPEFRPREVMIERVGFNASVSCIHRILCELMMSPSM